MSRQPAVHRQTSTSGAGDSEEATGGGAEAPGSRQTEQLQKILPELAGPPHPQSEGSQGKPAAPDRQGCRRGVRSGAEASQFGAARHAEAKQCAAGPRGAKGQALQGPTSALHT